MFGARDRGSPMDWAELGVQVKTGPRGINSMYVLQPLLLQIRDDKHHPDPSPSIEKTLQS
jgi:hypothetical protein